MRGVVVERVEVVEDRLDLGALHDPEPEPGEDVLDLAARLGQQVVAADGPDRRAGQRDVDAVGGEALLELAGLELGAAVGDEALERLAGLVGRLADAPALGRLELGDPAQEVRQLRLAAQEANAQRLQRGRVERGADRRLRLGPELVDALQGLAHARCTLENS